MYTWIGQDEILVRNMEVLKSMLKLELIGLKRSRGKQTAYAMIKENFGISGSKKRVYDQFCEIVENAKGRLKGERA